MSLLEKNKEKFKRKILTETADGEGGYTSVWADGATIALAMYQDTSTQAKIAEKSGVTDTYTILADKSIQLSYHDVLERVRDGKIFRVTSDGSDFHTPDGAFLNLRKVSAEEWKL